jgi:hypothetical protein
MRSFPRTAAIVFVLLSAISRSVAAQGPGPISSETLQAVKNKPAECGAYPLLLLRLSAAASRQRQEEADADLKNLGRSAPIATAKIDEELIALKVEYERLPFYVEIAGPCGRAAAIVERATKRYEDAILPAVDDLNRDGVVVRVRPSRVGHNDAQRAIEDYVAGMTKEENPYRTPALRLLEEARQQKKADPATDPFSLARPIENVIVKRGDTVFRPARREVKPLTIKNAEGASKDVNEGEFFFPFEAFSGAGDVVIVMISGDSTYEVAVRRAELARVK